MNNESGHLSLVWSKGDLRTFQSNPSKNSYVMMSRCPPLEGVNDAEKVQKPPFQ